ncbi:MAG: hypothetical protein HQ559_01605 [Lentisphaerae bacterium]|nr:hypothetical protein [Lentisphaerota bacterium]
MASQSKKGQANLLEIVEATARRLHNSSDAFVDYKDALAAAVAAGKGDVGVWKHSGVFERVAFRAQLDGLLEAKRGLQRGQVLVRSLQWEQV